MKFKLVFFAVVLALVFCSTSINIYSAPTSNDTQTVTYYSDGTYDIKIQTNNVIIITTYDSSGGVIRVITQPIG